MFVGPVTDAPGKTERAGPGPPQPVAVKVKARRDEATPIPLRIFGTRNQTLTFLVRKPPAHGKLGAPEKLGAESAVVRYSPPGDRTVTRETFTYAVRSAEGVSAPVEVTIEIVDLPAELTAPAELRFGSVLTGTETAQTFELLNRGGDPAEGEIQVDAPWRIDGSARYQLETGGRKFVRVIFAPTSPGQFEAELRYSSEAQRVTTMYGEGRAPLAVQPERLDLSYEPLTGARTGSFEVINHSGVPQTVQLLASERLKLDRHLMLAAGGRTAVAVQIAPVDIALFSEIIRLKATDYEAVLPVHADPKPAVLRISPESLGLHSSGAGGAWRGELQLENIGGTTLQADLRTSAPFALSTARITLPAGAKETLVITAAGGESRRLEGALTIHSSEGQRTVPLRGGAPGAVLASARTEQVRSPESPPREETREVERGRLKLSGEQSMHLPSLAATRVVDCTETSATLEWTGTLPSGGVRGEMRELLLVNHQLVIRWQPHPAFKAEAGDGKVRGTFNGLKPGQFHAVRVMPKRGDASAEPVASAGFETRSVPKRKPLVTRARVLLIIGVAMIGAVLWERYRSRRVSL